MTINSLKDLLMHPTFKILARTQAHYDDENYELRESGTTRSPYQLTGWLLLWLLTADENKYIMIQLLNNIIQITREGEETTNSSTSVHEERPVVQSISKLRGLKVEDLNALVRAINWQALAVELQDSSEAFLEITLPTKIVNNLSSFACYEQIKGFVPFIMESPSDEIIIKENNSAKYRWLKPLNNWIIPEHTYTLSQGLKEVLEGKKQELLTKGLQNKTYHMGVFQISLQKKEGRSAIPLKDSYQISLTIHNAITELSTELHNTEVESELYSLFEGMTFEDGSIIGKIRVELQGSSVFTQAGIGIKPSCTLTPSNSGYFDLDKNPWCTYWQIDIQITVVHALFAHTLTTATYHNGGNFAVHNYKNKYISLSALPEPSVLNEKDAIRLYAQALNHRDVLEICSEKEQKVPNAAAFHKIPRVQNKERHSMHSCSLM